MPIKKYIPLALKERARALQVARGTEGVKSVVDRLKVSK